MTLEERVQVTVTETEEMLKITDYRKLSTCPDWERGAFGADSQKCIAITHAIPILRRNGYNISSSVNHGIIDHMVYAKIDIE